MQLAKKKEGPMQLAGPFLSSEPRHIQLNYCKLHLCQITFFWKFNELDGWRLFKYKARKAEKH